jgi:hypothetical protein
MSHRVIRREISISFDETRFKHFNLADWLLSCDSFLFGSARRDGMHHDFAPATRRPLVDDRLRAILLC